MLAVGCQGDLGDSQAADASTHAPDAPWSQPDAGPANADAAPPSPDADLPPTVDCDVVAADSAALDQALADLVAGDTVCMAAGIWSDLSVEVVGQGTADEPIVLAAETPGETIIDGSSQLSLSGQYVVVQGLVFRGGDAASGSLIEFRGGDGDCEHCRLTETAIIDVDRDADASKWVSLYGAHNRVDHCWFSGKDNEGALLVVWRPDDSADYHLVDHNYFGDRPPLGANGAEGIRVGTSDTHDSDSFTVVEHNFFTHMDGEIEIISNKSGHNLYRHNTFRACDGLLTLRHGDDCTVTGNYFFADGVSGAGGIRVIGARHVVTNNYVEGVRTGSNVRGGIVLMSAEEDPAMNGYQLVDQVVIAFNTIVDSEQSLVFGGGSNPVPPRQPTLANNLVAGAVEDVVRVIAGLDDPTFEGNLFHGDALGLEDTDGITFSDPGLEVAADGLWRPAADSPAIGGAVGSYPEVTTDFEGQPRDNSPDVGADERSDAPVSLPPLTAADVGPQTYRP